MGVNIIVSTLVLVAIGGDVNGPTIGGILTIAGFSVKGKHVKNILPVMAGVILSGVLRGDGAVVTPGAAGSSFRNNACAGIGYIRSYRRCDSRIYTFVCSIVCRSGVFGRKPL